MRGSTGIYTSEDLSKLLDKGAYRLFLTSLSTYDLSHRTWFRFQLLGLSVLLDLKSSAEAIALTETLSESLIQTSERKLARAHYLLMAWFQGGRRSDDLEELEEMLNTDIQDSRLANDWNHIRLRAEVLKLVLGLSCTSQKEVIAEGYGAQVRAYLDEGREGEAFFCLLEQVDFLAAKPYPNLTLSIDILDHFIFSSTFNGVYRQGKLFALKATFTAEQQLSSGQPLSVQNIMSQAHNAWQEIGGHRDYSDTLLRLGSLLLRFGKPKGQKLLMKSIRYFQSAGEYQSILAPVNSLINWYQETGNHTELGSIKELHSIALTAIQKPQHDTKEQKRDDGLRLQMAVFQAQSALTVKDMQSAKQIIDQVFETAKPNGITRLSIQVEAIKVRYDSLTGVNLNFKRVMHVVARFCELSYPHDALEFLSSVVLDTTLREQHCFTPEYLEKWLELVDGFMREIEPDLHLIQALGSFYEAVGLCYLKSGDLQKSKTVLENAHVLFKRYQLRPKSAFNLLYQAKITRLQFEHHGKSLDAKLGLKALHEAATLFRLMRFKEGVRQATQDETEFLSRVSNFSQLDTHSETTKLSLKVLASNSNLVRLQLGSGSLYRAYSEIVKSRIAGYTFFHSQSLN